MNERRRYFAILSDRKSGLSLPLGRISSSASAESNRRYRSWCPAGTGVSRRTCPGQGKYGDDERRNEQNNKGAGAQEHGEKHERVHAEEQIDLIHSMAWFEARERRTRNVRKLVPWMMRRNLIKRISCRH